MSILSRLELSRLLPHGDAMCLLDSVENWDSGTIRCLTRSHRDRRNPLGRGGRLEAICGLEYAAQAMAVHAGLVRTPGETQPVGGYLGGVRDLKVDVQCLDDIEHPLDIEAARLIVGNASVMYSFSVSAGGKQLLRGRASIFFIYTKGSL